MSTHTREDSMHHKQLRQQLLNQLHLKGITNVTVLEAMNRVPRHLFLNEAFSAAQSYEDCALPILNHQTISQPYTVAYQTSFLNIVPHEKILEIGTGSGYQAAVLFETGAEVYTIERQKILYKQAHKKLAELGYSAIHTFYGDGHDGVIDYAPYDKILLTATSDEIPDKLFQQLKRGGIMLLPTNNKMLRITKNAKGEMEIDYLDRFVFVPLLKGVTE